MRPVCYGAAFWRLALSALLCSGLGGADGAQEGQAPLIPWTRDFKEAQLLAAEDALPLYVYVTGSSWCVWCKRMDRELHDHDSFRQKTIGKFHFVKLELASGSAPTEALQAVLARFQIRGVPTVLILSPKGEEKARFRYERMDPAAYAELVLEAATRAQASVDAVSTDRAQPTG